MTEYHESASGAFLLLRVIILMWSPHNFRMPTSFRSTTVYDSGKTLSSPKVHNRSSTFDHKCYIRQVSQSLINFIREQQPLSQDWHFQGRIIRKNVWPRSVNKTNLQVRKAKLHNMPEYLINSLKHRHTIGNRFQPHQQAIPKKSFSILKERKLKKIRTDIQELHREMSAGNGWSSQSISLNFDGLEKKEEPDAVSPKLSRTIRDDKMIETTANKTISPSRRAIPQKYFLAKIKQKKRVLDKIQISPWQVAVD